jgi:hypothetical protein
VREKLWGSSNFIQNHPKKEGNFKKIILLPYVLYSQIWLNLLVDDCQFGYRYPKIEKQGVCHTMALPFYIQKYLQAKEEL